MSNVFETRGPDFVIRWLLAAGREVRTMLGGPTRAAQVCVVVETTAAQRAARVSFIAAHHDARWVDAVAGCEYVDDRIRLRE